MNTRNKIIQPTQFAVLDGYVYIGEDDHYPQGRKPDLQGEVFDDVTISTDKPFSEAEGLLLLVADTLQWKNSDRILHTDLENGCRVEYVPEA